jgi:ACS family hexuronate transporter-like MFS transporter
MLADALPTSRTAAVLPRLRWIVGGILLLASVKNYVDRQTLSILAPVIQSDLGISDAGYATVVQAFMLAYTMMYLVSGRIVDRIGTRIAEFLFIIWWSLANLATCMASGVLSLGILRALLGGGEPGNFTAAAKAVSEWFPARERGIAVGLYSMGGTLGAAIAAPLVTWLTIGYGWRMAFVITGAAGFVLAGLWLWAYRTPSLDPRLRLDEREALIAAGVMDGGSQAAVPIPWRRLATNRAMLAILAARTVTDPLWYFYLFWFPKYLQERRSFTLAEVGATLWIVFVAADLGCLVGGWVSGFRIRRGDSPVAARLWTMAGAAAILSASFTLPLLSGHAFPLASASLFAFAHMVWMTNSTTLPIDCFPSDAIGSVQGAVGTGSSLGGFASAGLIGYVVTHFSYAPLFTAMSFLHPVAFVVLWFLLPRERQLNT